MIIQIVEHEHEKLTKDKAPDNLLLYQMILLHETYQKLESQLQHLKQITTLNSNVSTKLQAYFKLRETDIVSITSCFLSIYVCYIIMYMCIITSSINVIVVSPSKPYAMIWGQMVIYLIFKAYICDSATYELCTNSSYYWIIHMFALLNYMAHPIISYCIASNYGQCHITPGPI